MPLPGKELLGPIKVFSECCMRKIINQLCWCKKTVLKVMRFFQIMSVEFSLFAL